MPNPAVRRAWPMLLVRWLFLIFAIVEQSSSPWHVYQRDSAVDLEWLSHLHMPAPQDGQTYASDGDEEIPLLGVDSVSVGRAIVEPDGPSGCDLPCLLPVHRLARPVPPRDEVARRWAAGAPRAPPSIHRSLPPPPHAPPLLA